MNSVASVLSRAIKEGKWVTIEYDNKKEEKLSYFWIAILDIEPKTKKMKVQLFNQEKGLDVIQGTVYFEQIKKAEIIEGTTTPLAMELIQKILSNYSDFDFLEYSGINERILQYYKECYQQDKEGTVQRYNLVKGIDEDLLRGNPYPLDDERFEEFVINLKLHQKKQKKKSKQELIRMAINVLAIHTDSGLFPIVYRDLLLNVEKRQIIAAPSYSFNICLNDDNDSLKFDLSHYFDGDVNQFMNDFENRRNEFIQELSSNCRYHEIVDERPYLFKFIQFIPINIQLDYRRIQTHFKEQTLPAPLKAFFGFNEKERKRRGKSILISSNEINMDQLRVLHSAMNKEIVYVQGPPGTGKTATIINVLTSCLLNKTTALIVSNNNEAINNIQRKCASFIFQDQIIPFPLLRLGSNENIKSTLSVVHDSLDTWQSAASSLDKEELKELQQYFKDLDQPLEEAISEYEDKVELTEQVEALSEVIKNINNESEADEISKSMTILGIKVQMENLGKQLGSIQEKNVLEACQINHEKMLKYLFLASLNRLSHLFNRKNQTLLSILNQSDEEERLQNFRTFLNEEENAGLLSIIDCFPFILSTNISCTKLGQADATFDLLIMDEASQCSNALALLPMARAKRALFVGDQNQLQPVIVLNPEKNQRLLNSFDIPSSYDYKKNSILSTLLKIDTLSTFILLREHYRCNRQIIEFSNQKYYGGELLLKSKLHNTDALKLIDISSSAPFEKNTCKEEIDALVKEIKNSNTNDIAVITPFRKQADLIEKTLYKNHLDYVKTGTIHTFQGDEKTKIILCSGLSKSTQPGSFNWLKNNQELINVATTRAKENLVLITDTHQVEALSKMEANDFLELVNYIRKDGNIEIQNKTNELFTSKVKNYKYYNSRSEEEFLKTLLHIKSIYGQIRIESKVKVTDVLNLSRCDRGLFTYGNQAHFDYVLYNLQGIPLLAIEVCGNEHLSQEKVVARDAKKQAICQKHNLTLLTIKNDYVRRYSYIKDTILDALSEK